MVNMGKYLLKKGKVCENNECRKTASDLSRLRQIFPPYLPQADRINRTLYFLGLFCQ